MGDCPDVVVMDTECPVRGEGGRGGERGRERVHSHHTIAGASQQMEP